MKVRVPVAALLTLAVAASFLHGCGEMNSTQARLAAGGAHPYAGKGVGAWEEQVKIPTYMIGPPDPNPQFYLGGQSQGAQQRIYPYPSYDILTTDKVDKPYNMVYLENEYIKIGILPESGGRIFYSEDKTNGYAFFYNQHVIKPALISLLGAWISGGVEWDIPHHHRATSFVPVQYKIENNPDGSKTVWVGELELRDQMLWSVGLTLHPGKSYLEASFRMVNRTPVPTSMLCFSNVGVHAGVEYQIIFPPSTQLWTNHKKPSYQPWTDQLSWLKNHPISGSWFAYNLNDDFMAGYDHGKHAGTMSIADHNVVPGKKFFTWGTDNTAEFNRLTDADGPYLELMVGAYSDNQPDYSWMAPFETRSWTQVWYPFHSIDGVKCANIEAAVNLEVSDGKIKMGLFSTSDRPTATATLKLKDKVLLSEKIAISPGKAYTKEIPLPAGADEHDLRASLSEGDKELVAYSPVRLTPVTPPTPVAGNYPAPASVKTNEELLLIAQRIEQFNTPYDPINPGTSINNAIPETYWNEALSRDPGDIRVNTAMGIKAIKGGRFADAEKYLRTALQRATDRITTPRDGEPYYYLGLALKGQGKLDDAFDQFSQATWSGAWRGPGYFEMAEIACSRAFGVPPSGGRPDIDAQAALEYINNALNANAENTRALALKSALLRHAGRNAEAIACTEAIRKIDPLDVHGIAERWLADKSAENAHALAAQLNQLPATGLQVAGDYQEAGLWQDGLDFLAQVVNAATDKRNVSPLVYYYMGYFAQQKWRPSATYGEVPLHRGSGEVPGEMEHYCRIAAQQPTDYVFPFQMELLPVLEFAMSVDSKDARAPYYLGNLLFDWQPQRALALWEKSAELGADFPVVYRNLAMVYSRQGNQRDKVIAALEKAVQFGGNAVVFEQLDRLYEENGVAPDKRLALLEKNQSVLIRAEVMTREINLAVFAGKPDLAISLIKSRYFRAWEGRNGFSMGDAWVNANLAAGHQRLAARQYKEALAAYQAALQLPPTLAEEGGGNIIPRRSEVNYFVGVAYETMGDMTKARQAWTDASTATAAGGGRGGPGGGRGGRGGVPIGAGVRVASADPYFQAAALQKLDQGERARTMFQQLIDTGTQALAGVSDPQTLAQKTQAADAHYVVGLGNLGLNNREKARQEFSAALQASPDHLAAKMTLASLAP